MNRIGMLVTMLILSLAYSSARAQDYTESDKIRGTWFNEEGDATIDIYRAKNGKYYGKINWLKEPMENGKPKVDDENPDVSKQNEPLLGLLIMKGAEYKGDKIYKNGTIYDPDNGKTYDCIITLSTPDKLDLRGYIGISLIGRTSYWTRKK